MGFSTLDFVTHKEVEFIKNLADMLEKTLNDKILLNKEEEEKLEEIKNITDILEESIYELSEYSL